MISAVAESAKLHSDDGFRARDPVSLALPVTAGATLDQKLSLSESCPERGPPIPYRGATAPP